MARFTTPYDTLLRVRRIEEDKAKAKLATANADHRAALEQLGSARQAHLAAMKRSHTETTVDGFMRDALHGQRLAEQVVRAGRHAETTEETRRTALDEVTVAAMRTQGLERLIERARAERDARILAADQRVAEESIAGARERARSRKKKGAR